MALSSHSFLHVRLLYHYLKLFSRPAAFLFGLLTLGTLGYILIESYSLLEGIYMTVVTISTVGFSEVRPLSDGGRIFTIFLILGGVLFYGLAINVVFQIIIERSFKGFMEAQILKEKLKTISGHYIVCGGGRMALAICTELEKAGHDFIVIEKNSDSPVFKTVEQRRVPWMIMTGDALSEETLEEARLDRAEGFFSVLPTDADNLFVVLSARRLNSKIWIETRIAHETTRPKMLQAGANRVLSPYHVAGIQMARSMLRPQVDDFVEIFLGENNYEFEAKIQQVQAGDNRIGKTLADCQFGEEGFTVAAVKSADGKLSYAPPGETPIVAGISIFLLGRGRN